MLQAVEHGLKTIAIPSLTLGEFGYSLQEEAKIAVKTVKSFIDGVDGFDEMRVRFVLCGEHAGKVYQIILNSN